MGSPHHNLRSHPMSRPHKCSVCGKSYAMEWARNNHQKLCKELKGGTK